MRHLHRAGILREQLRGLQPHHLTAGPSPSGQTAPIRVPHSSRHRTSARQDHADTPNIIRSGQTHRPQRFSLFNALNSRRRTLASSL